MSVESFYGALGVDLSDRPGPELPVRCFVPEHDHRHGDRNPSVSVNADTGAFYCHTAGEGGGPYQAALALGKSPAEAMALLEEHGLKEREAPPRPAPSTNGDLSEAAVKRFRGQLAADGAAGRRLEELRGWSAQTVERLELGLDRDRVVFPVRNAEGALVGRLRYAPDPARRNGAKKLLADRGTPRELWPPPESLAAEHYLLAEGEPDAVSGYELGFAAVGIPGTGSADRFDPTRFAGRHVVVCFDCDDAGRDAARKAAESLVPHAATVKVLDLDPSRDDGYDLGDYLLEAAECGEQGKADARRLLERMAEATEPLEAGPAEPELAELLDELAGFVRRYVVMSDAQTAVVALWTVHTHAIEAADVTPFLAVTSAEKRSGKSLLLDVLELLCARPWRVISPSEAVTFRKIERDRPTLELDEVDAIFKGASERTEPLRALLNAGNRRGTTVPRCVGPNQELRDFATFCPRALAGIGELPATVADRSVPIRLERRAPGERVERYRRRHAEPQAQPLREALERFATEAEDELRHAEPELPDELDDRAQDAAEPLLAIADMAGVDWPRRARAALIELCAGRQAEDESIGVRLLEDIRQVLGDQDRIATAELLERLNLLEEAPWGDWYGKALTSRALAKLLKPYGVKSRSVRLDDGSTPKGYHRDQLEAVWKRYLPVGGASIRHSATTRSGSGIEPGFNPPQDPAVADTKTPSNPHEQWDVAGVADKSPDTGTQGDLAA